MLLGRTTYEEWSDYWPTSTNEPFASHINGVPKFVVSRSLDAVPWGDHGNATLVDGDLADAMTHLKEQPGGTIGVHGSHARRGPSASRPARRDAPRDLSRPRGRRRTTLP
jgi:dihydrofolate reductase